MAYKGNRSANRRKATIAAVVVALFVVGLTVSGALADTTPGGSSTSTTATDTTGASTGSTASTDTTATATTSTDTTATSTDATTTTADTTTLADGSACGSTGNEKLTADYQGGNVEVGGTGFATLCQVTVRVTGPGGAGGSGTAQTDLSGAFSYSAPLSGPTGSYVIDALGAGDAVLMSASFDLTPGGSTTSLIVKLASGLSSSDQAAVIARDGGTETSSVPALQLHVVEVPSSDADATLARYQADSQVTQVEVDKTREAGATPSDTAYPSQWALTQIGWDQVFGGVNPTGTPTIAVLDTGVSPAGGDLSVGSGWSAFGGDPSIDPNGHGTWVASIAAATSDNGAGIAGVDYAKGTTILPVQVLDANGVGQDSDIVQGVVWAADHGADVILMSFSNPGFSPALQDAIDYAWSKGAVVVAATGNDGVSTPTFPAGDAEVMGVSATDQSDALSSASNYGQDTFLAAPGVDVTADTPSGDTIAVSGTSASAAIVAGAAALLKANDPTLTNGVIVGRLARNADPAGTTDQTGNGRLNLQRALSDTSTDEVVPSGAAPVGSGGPLVGPYVAAASDAISADVTPAYDPGSKTTTFSTLVRGTGNGNPIQHVQITLPTGYTNISVPSVKAANGTTETNPAFSSGTWSAPVVNQANRTIDVSLTSGSGLTQSKTPGQNGWARIDVTATTPATQVSPADVWTFSGWTNANGNGNPQAQDVPTVLVNATGSTTTATLSWVDGSGNPISAPVLQNGVAATLRLRVTQNNNGAKYTAIALPTCFSSPSAISTTVSGGGAGSYSIDPEDNFILLPGGSIPNGGFLTVQFTTMPNCQSGVYSAPVAPSTNQTNPASGDNQVVAVTSAQLSVNAGLADLSITKTDSPDPVATGGTLTYTLRVHNTGPDDASAVKVVDPLPVGVTFVSATGTNWTCANNSGTVTCNRTGGNLAAGTDAPDITVTVTAPTGGKQTISNSATVSSPNDVTPANDTATATTLVDNPPSLTTPSFSPVSPKTNDTLTASTTTSDVDGDQVSVAWTWKVTRAGNTCTVKTDSSALAAAGTRTSSLDLSQTYTTTSCTGTNPGTINPSKGDAVTVEATPTDAPGLSGTLKSNTVTIANSAPTVTLTSAPSTANEGDTKTYAFTTSDPDGDTLSFVNGSPSCGAGGTLQGSPTVAGGTFSCTFPDGPATSTVSVQVTDGTDNSNTASQAVTVNNVAPTVTFTSAPGTANEGDTKHYAYTISDPGQDTQTVATSCGANGIKSNATNTDTSGGFDCTFPDGPANSTVTAQATDSDTATGNLATQLVTVANVAPTVTAPANQSANEGASASFGLGSFSDPGANDASWSVDVNWGDNSTHTTFSTGTQGALGSRTHTYADNGTYTVTVTVTDKDGGVGSNTFKVVVANVAPTVTAPANQSASEGSPALFSLGSFSDPGANDAPWSVDVNWGDGSAHSTFPTSAQGSLGTLTHSYPDNGAYTVTVSVTDKDGGTGSAQFTVTVTNVPPTATLSNNGPVGEGSPATITFTGQFDPSSADTTAGFHYAYSCTNGDLSGATYANTAGSTASTQCTFADNGTYTVKARIIDKDGGFSEYQTAVQVNNVAPVVTAAANQSSNEGSVASFNLGSFGDPGVNDNPWSVDVNWGDGSHTTFGTSSQGTLPAQSHAYDDNGSYTVTVSVTDKDGGTGSAHFTVAVANVAPTATLSNNGPVGEGSPATITFSNQHDASGTDTAAGFHYAYSCSNGDLSTATYANTTASAASTTCTFSDNGDYTVKARIIDKDDGFTEYTTTVHVINVAPTVTPAGGQSSGEGSATVFNLGSFSDPGTSDNPWTVDVDWGDGSPHTGFSTATQGALPAKSHKYDDNGSYTVTVSVTDKDGGSASAQFSVTVANVAPTATLSNNGSVNEGSPATITFSGQSDPSGADTAAGFHYAYSCTNGDLSGATYANTAGSTASTQCTFADSGTYTVKGRIIDKDGGFNEYTTDVVVNNVPPAVTAAANQTSDEGSSSSFDLGSFSDPGVNDGPWAVDVNWGDGSPDTTFSASTQGALGSKSHTFDDNTPGGYTVMVTVTDKHGGPGSASFNVDVHNVAPTAIWNAPFSVNEGSPIFVSLTNPSDPSNADTAAGFKYSFDCGTGAGFSPLSSDNTFSCPTNDNGGRTVKGRIYDKDGGFTEYTRDVVIQNVAPTATLSNNGPVDESSAATITFTGQFDPSSVDTAAGFHYAFSCSNGDLSASTYAGSGTAPAATCSYPDGPSAHTVRARIIDKDGGYSEYTTDVVVRNVAPSVTPPANQSSNEGSSASFDLGSFSDPGVNDAPWTVDVNWGDTSTDPSFTTTAQGSLGSLGHTYDDNGTYTVTVQVEDKDGGVGTAQFQVTVANVAPTATLTNDGPVDEGSPATISFGNQSDPSHADTTAGFHYAFDCSNGDLSGGTYANSGTSSSTTCTFDDGPSDHVVKARIIDKDGGSTEYTTTVHVNNVPPTATFSNSGPIPEGSTATITFSGQHDASAADEGAGFHYAYSCSGADLSGSTYGNSGTPASTTCSFDDGPSVHTVTGRIIDKDGGFTDYTTNVVVNNVSPIATLSNDGPVNEGSPATISFGSQFDPSTADTQAGFHYAYDCSNGDLSGATYANTGGSTPSTQCAFADNGTYTVKARIIDKDDGYSEYTTKVTVLNVPPSVTAPADQTASEGTAKTFDLGSFTDPGANDNPWHVVVAWGDGSPATAFDTSSRGAIDPQVHNYDDNGNYLVTVSVTDKDGDTGAAQFHVAVANVPPTATLSNDGPVHEGSPATLTFSGQHDPSGADTAAGFHYEYSCDGSPFGPVDYSTADVSATHQCTFADNGTYTVLARIIDKDNGFTPYTTTVVVDNVPPTVTPAGNQLSSEGTPATFNLGSFSDPGTHDNPWTVVVNWGDGHSDSFPTATQGPIAPQSHTYDDGPQTYTVAVTVTDKDGGVSLPQTFQVSVANVAPTASLTATTPVNEGSPATVTFSGQFDPSGADTAAGFHYAYSCTNGDLSGATYANTAGSAASTQCTFADNGTYTVKARIIDKDNGFSEYTTDVVVNNVPPTVTAPANQSSNEGSLVSFNLGSFSDPGALDAPWHVVVNWGDSTPNTAFDTSSRGTIDAQTHTFDDGPHTYTVTVTVTDKDGGSGAATFKVTVANVNPTATFNAPDHVAEGTPVFLSLTNPSDPSNADTQAGFTYSFDCGDGNGFSLRSSDSTFSCPTVDNGNRTVTGRIYDKDNGFSEYSHAVTIENVPPTVSTPGNQSADEGTSASFNLGSFSDPGVNDAPWHVVVDWGDGSPHDSFDTSTQGSLGTLIHTYANNTTGGYTVSVSVTDKDNGTGSTQFNVDVHNVPPQVSFTSAPDTADEGQSKTYTFTVFDPGTVDTYAAAIGQPDCGNGGELVANSYHVSGTSGQQTGTFDCHFPDGPANPTVTIAFTDSDGDTGNLASQQVLVNNVAPTVTLTGDLTVNEGTTHTYTFEVSDPGQDTFSISDTFPKCGANGQLVDGSVVTTASGGTFDCFFPDGPATTDVAIRVQDSDGAASTDVQDVNIRTVGVNNVAPTATLTNDGPVNEGSPTTISFSNQSDPSPTDTAVGFRYEYHCDGSAFAATADYSSADPSATHPCTFPDNGIYTVTARIIDKDNAFTTYGTTVTVDNVPPSVSAPADQTANEGALTSFSIGSFSDPGLQDGPWNVDVNWGDGSHSTFPAATQGSLGNLTHPYVDNGSYPVTVTVTDKDNGVGSATFHINVANVPPTVTAPAGQSTTEGQSTSFDLGSFSDPGANDAPWTVDVNWGDGHSDHFSQGGQGTIAPESHTYADNTPGGYTVSVTVTDKDGGSDTKTFNVSVANVAPTVTAAASQASNEGSSASFDLGSFSDPGVNDAPWHVVVNWGDGHSDNFDTGTQGALGSKSHTYDDNGTYAVNVSVTDKDGATGSASFAVNVANVPPTATFNAPASVNEGSSIALSLTNPSDPSNADTHAGFTYSFNCYDGNGWSPQSASSTFSCSTNDNGTRTVKGRIYDKDGGYTTYTATVTINNVPPTATFTAPSSVDEGTPIFLSLDNAHDASSVDQASLTYSFDCGSGYSAPSSSNTFSCPTNDNGSRTVKGKVMDKDGGFSEYTATVTINNVPPTATLTNNGPVFEGSPATITFSNASDPSSVDTAAGFHYAFDCAGGSLAGSTYSGSSTNPQTTCVYGDNGSYVVTGRIIDKDGGYTDYTTTVQVNNAPPVVTSGGNQSSSEGSSVSFNLGSFSDAGANDGPWPVDVNWGDGSVDTTFTASTQGSLGSRSHTYDDGTHAYTVTVTVADKDAGTGSASFTVNVANVPPTATFNAPASVDEGSSIALSLTNPSDPSGADTAAGFMYQFDCGTGSGFSAKSTTSTAACPTTDNGSRTVKGRIYDKDNGYTTYTATVTVNNVAPTADLGNNGPVSEGAPVTVSFSNQFDPSSADTAAVFHYAFDCAGGTLPSATYGNSGTTASFNCSFPDNGTYTVTGRIFDKDNGSTLKSTTVTVNNVPPTVTAPANQSSNEGSSASFSLGSLSDPGTNDSPWSVDVDWGDGSAHTTFPAATQGSLGTKSHTYDDNGTYTVTVTVTDKDGGVSAPKTFQVAVANVAPTATFNAPSSVNEGMPIGLSLTGPSDPSGADTAAGFTYAFDCGDGSGYGAFSSTSNIACPTTDNGTRTVKGKIKDKDGGVTEYTKTVTINNVPPSVTPPSNQTSVEGSSASFNLGSFSDPGVNDGAWQVSVSWGDTSSATSFSKTAQGMLGSQSHTYADNGTYTVTVSVTDKDGGTGQNTFTVTVSNVPPAISSFTGTATGLFGPTVVGPVNFNGTFTDPGVNDGGTIKWSWDGTADPTANQTYAPSVRTFSQTHTYTAAGCNHSATVTVTDKDGGSDAKTITVGVGTGSFLPPMTNQPVTDKLKNNQVLPVKVQIVDCNGQPVNNLTPAIRLVVGDQTPANETITDTITPNSSSSADTTGVMRSSGTDGSYIYNMIVNIPLNSPYTVIIYPYWTSGTPTGTTLRHLIVATK